MGFVQKIFYFHVPCAIMLFLSTFVCAGGSIAFLFKGSERGDRLAVAAAELGVLFGVCVLTSGPLWGRKAWGVWWQWDARLTTSLLLFLMMVAYLMARRYGGPAGRSWRRRCRCSPRSTCRSSTRASTSGGRSTRRRRW